METLFVDKYGHDVVATPGNGTMERINLLSGTNNLNFILVSNKAPIPKALELCEPTSTVIFTIYLEKSKMDDDGIVDVDEASKVVANWENWLDHIYDQYLPKGFYFMNLHPTALGDAHNVEETLKDFNQGIAIYEQRHVCKRVN